MTNAGPLPQADLLALYRRLIRATVELERRDRERSESRSAGRFTWDDAPRLPAATRQPAGLRSSISQAWSSACQAIRRAA